jgi:magnesium transporter
VSLRLFDARAERSFHFTTLDELQRLDGQPVTWIDATGPTEHEIDALGAQFGFHPLALEDARKRQQRPKVDIYPSHLFIVLYALDPPEVDARMPMRELAMFITPSVVVTIHRHDIEELDAAARRWAEHCASGMREETTMIAYTIADTVVDGYFPCLDAYGDRIESLEQAVFDEGRLDTLEEVFRLKRQLLDMRRVVAPTRDVFNAFTRREFPLLGDPSLIYFQDVYDHVIRITDTIDAFRDILSSVIDVHLTIVSNRLNQTVRTLTSASIILMTLALIAGVYGMNFDHMPELGWRFGYFGVLVMMALVAMALAWIFRRLGWW